MPQRTETRKYNNHKIVEHQSGISTSIVVVVFAVVCVGCGYIGGVGGVGRG